MSEPAPREIAPPGEVLRRAREARSLTVAEAAEALRLRPRQIEAIEDGDFASFKGLAYARGFVRNYARFLETDPAPLLAAMNDASAGETVRLSPTSNAAGVMPRGGSARGVPRWLAVLALAGLAAVILVTFYDGDPFAPSGDRLQPAAVAPEAARLSPAPPAPPAPATPAAEPAVEPAAASPAAAQPVQPAQPPGGAASRIELRFAKSSWVEITDATGKVLLSRTEPSGGAQSVDGTPPFSLVIGNADGVELKYRDRSVDLRPHTARNIARLRLE